MAANHFESELPIASDAVLWCDLSRVEALIAARDSTCSMVVRIIDVSEATSKRDVRSAVAKALDFPAYFADNWDSFEECLAEPDRLEDATHVVVVFRGANKLFVRGTDAETLFSIFRDVANEWASEEHGMRLSVVLLGQSDAASSAVLEHVGIGSLS